MKPVDQCNACNNRNCDKKVYRNPLTSFVPCKLYRPPLPFKQRLMHCAIAHEIEAYGEVRYAGKLR